MFSMDLTFYNAFFVSFFFNLSLTSLLNTDNKLFAITTLTLHTSGCFSAKVLKPRLIRLMQHFHCDYFCLMSPNKDETRSQSVTIIAVDGLSSV